MKGGIFMLLNVLTTATGVITPDMVGSVTDIVSSNVNAILPSGVKVMAIMIGVGLVPKIFHKFV